MESYRKECTQSTQTCWLRESEKPAPAFTERFSLSMRALRVEALLESILQSAKQAFISSMLATLEGRLHAVNQSLSSFQSSEKANVDQVACAFGLIDSTSKFLLKANLSACAAFSKQTSRFSQHPYSASA